MDWSRLRENREMGWFVLDLLMLLLVLLNLTWILFDSLFSARFIQDNLAIYTPGFFNWYLPIHENFFFYDLCFVVIFVAELFLRWTVAIVSRTYYRWWFYPFIHWYDVLGCLPAGAFRILRIFRVVSILFRLQRNRVIDLTRTYFFKKFQKYYYVAVEEVSDRVVVNVLDGVKEEVGSGSPVAERILKEVILPRRDVLVEWLSDRITSVAERHYEDYKPDLRDYVEQNIKTAVASNKEISTLESLPVVGKTLSTTLERAISDIVFNVINGIVQDVASASHKELMNELSGIMLESVFLTGEDRRLDDLVRDMATDSIDLITEQVKVQQWKLREEKEDEIRKRAKAIKKIRKAKSV